MYSSDFQQQDIIFSESFNIDQAIFDSILEALEDGIFEEYDDLFERLSR